jgi:hypothetical protein
MCDYSLAHFPNRLAVEGDQLVLHRFKTGTLGLAPACFSLKQMFSPDSTPAVGVLPGARLLLQDVPERLQEALDVGPVEEATFVEHSADAFQYRDAVRFGNGREILLQQLASGQRVLVLSLDTGESETTEPDALRQIDTPLHELDAFFEPGYCGALLSEFSGIFQLARGVESREHTPLD